jgi:hypothetical protein
MDLTKIIHQLREERDQLNAIIHSIEQMNGGVLSSANPGRHGRPAMTAADRLEVSRPMKAYWLPGAKRNSKVRRAGTARPFTCKILTLKKSTESFFLAIILQLREETFRLAQEAPRNAAGGTSGNGLLRSLPPGRRA